jgi:transposase-like protein
MSEKLGGARRRRSRAEVDQLVAEYEASGLTRQEFCARHGLALATLDRYRKRRQQRRESSSADSRFIRVELAGAKQAASHSSSDLIVLLSNARRIEVKRGFDADMLAQLVRVLEQV